MVCPTTHFLVVKDGGEQESVVCYIPREERACLEYLKTIAIHIEWEVHGCLPEEDPLSVGSWTKENVLYSSRDMTPLWTRIRKLRDEGKHKSYGDIQKEENIPNTPIDDPLKKEKKEPQGWRRLF